LWLVKQKKNENIKKLKVLLKTRLQFSVFQAFDWVSSVFSLEVTV